MKTCLCGSAVDDKSTRCPQCAALRVLGLEMDATENEIRSAYRLLVKVWHPDRFQSDPKLNEVAEAKLKDVNSAYAILASTFSQRGQWQRPRPASANAASRGSPQKTRPTPKTPSTRRTAPGAIPSWSPPLWLRPTIKILYRIAIVTFAILLYRYIWIAFADWDYTNGDVARVYGFGKEAVLKGLEAPKRRFLEAVEQDLRRLDPRKAAPAPAALPQTAETAIPADPQTGQTAPEKATMRQSPKIQAAPRKIYSYITVGSTKDEVLAQQGTPTASSENKLVYGRSELYFKDNSVIGWRIDPASSPIRVKLWPKSSVDTSLDCFTVGSSKDVVLVVQGTPTAFSENKFEYGGSEVYFRNNRVVRWKNDPASAPLRTRLP